MDKKRILKQWISDKFPNYPILKQQIIGFTRFTKSEFTNVIAIKLTFLKLTIYKYYEY